MLSLSNTQSSRICLIFLGSYFLQLSLSLLTILFSETIGYRSRCIFLLCARCTHERDVPQRLERPTVDEREAVRTIVQRVLFRPTYSRRPIVRRSFDVAGLDRRCGTCFTCACDGY